MFSFLQELDIHLVTPDLWPTWKSQKTLFSYLYKKVDQSLVEMPPVMITPKSYKFICMIIDPKSIDIWPLTFK